MPEYETDLSTDVLVLGGGPAGTWAAVAALEAGVSVVLADKGFCGTSGAAAAGGNNLWFISPDEPEKRAASIALRHRTGGELSEFSWMHRTLDETWRGVHRLVEWGYPFPVDDNGNPLRSSLQGPQYMRLMRHRVQRLGGKILDQSPAASLLTDADGRVVGAAGRHRQGAHGRWRIAAKAVVLATGGCAFLSGALGCNPNTGDGTLMAAELGVPLSGMEFSSAYAMAPGFGSQTKGRMYQFAQYYSADGRLLELPEGFAARAAVARILVDQPVYARLDLAPKHLHEKLRWSQPNFFLPYDKVGIDPFTDLFEVRMILEGTVRGTGGVRLSATDCSTGVPGLYAAGDVASREPITGGVTGGGSHNGAWAISTGTWAGAAAAGYATAHPGRPAAAPPADRNGSADADEVVKAVQAQVSPVGINMFRHPDRLRTALAVLDELWSAAVGDLRVETGPRAHRAREAAAMVAHARWMYRAALARPESRAMHRREDAPAFDPLYTRRLLTGGLDEVWTRFEPIARAGEGNAA
jgi:succinate dehydrogenase/fumarate reductase flavoprotein subunit